MLCRAYLAVSGAGRRVRLVEPPGAIAVLHVRPLTRRVMHVARVLPAPALPPSPPSSQSAYPSRRVIFGRGRTGRGYGVGEPQSDEFPAV